MIRIGLGYDIHRVDPERGLVLGGVRIPSNFGLSGHSDADVLLHAVMDAVLGAAALGDIGYHFPPSDESFRDACSLDLLHRVAVLLDGARYRIINLDVVVVAEQPCIAPYAAEMRRAIAGVLGIEDGQISIKATTNEGVGPEGRTEAISAQAVALLEYVA